LSTFACVAASGSKVWMSVRCNSCGQADPYLGDSWCLACSAIEQLRGELRSAWGAPGSRSLAQDVLVSATRQVRALRRLGIAGAGKSRPSLPVEAGKGRASSQAPERASSAGRGKSLPEPPPPPEKEARAEETRPPTEVKQEVTDPCSPSAYSESGEEEDEVEDTEVPPEASGLKAVPKRRVENRSEIPRRRVPERPESDQRRGADAGRAPTPHRDRSRRRHSRSRDRRREEGSGRRRRREHREHRHQDRPEGKKKKRGKRKGHRAGAKHARLWRAAEDPFKRLHYRQPDSFWDKDPSLL
jgi:hypothetical protein